MHREQIYNLPNALSFVRIASIPLLIILASSSGRLMCFLAAAIFALAALTDLLDGYLARRLGRVTTLGRFLDPVADKLMVSAALIMLVSLDRAPAWVAFAIIGREIAVTGLRAAAAASTARLVIEARIWGKAKTVCQTVAVLGLLLHYPYLGLDMHQWGTVFLYAALALTLLSGWFYFREYWTVISLAGRSAENGGGE